MKEIFGFGSYDLGQWVIIVNNMVLVNGLQ